MQILPVFLLTVGVCDAVHILAIAYQRRREGASQEAAIAGHGVAMGIAPLVEEDLRQGRLVRPFGTVSENAYRFWMIRQAGQRAGAAEDAFCAWLSEEAADTSPR